MPTLRELLAALADWEQVAATLLLFLVACLVAYTVYFVSRSPAEMLEIVWRLT